MSKFLSSFSGLVNELPAAEVRQRSGSVFVDVTGVRIDTRTGERTLTHPGTRHHIRVRVIDAAGKQVAAVSSKQHWDDRELGAAMKARVDLLRVLYGAQERDEEISVKLLESTGISGWTQAPQRQSTGAATGGGDEFLDQW